MTTDSTTEPTPAPVTPLPIEPLLTKDEVADILRVSPRTVIEMARDGRLERIALPAGLRFSRAAVVKYIAEHTVAPAA